MKSIKLNWGSGIALTYLGFVAMIIVLVVMSINQKIDLVTDQYYVEELQFQDKINKKNRALSLTTPLEWSVNDKNIEITFPNIGERNYISGMIKLYCPSNDQNDRSINIQVKDNQQFIALADIPEGRYQLQIDWNSGSQSFLNEGIITIKHTN